MCESKVGLSRIGKRAVHQFSVSKSLKYAESLSSDVIYVLSAKHGLLSLEEIVEPYDLTLNQLSMSEVKRWAERTVEQLKQVANLASDRFIFLAGERYRRFIVPQVVTSEIPLQGLSVGTQLLFLKVAVNE
jgi:hypothetical protein